MAGTSAGAKKAAATRARNRANRDRFGGSTQHTRKTRMVIEQHKPVKRAAPKPAAKRHAAPQPMRQRTLSVVRTLPRTIIDPFESHADTVRFARTIYGDKQLLSAMAKYPRSSIRKMAKDLGVKQARGIGETMRRVARELKKMPYDVMAREVEEREAAKVRRFREGR